MERITQIYEKIYQILIEHNSYLVTDFDKYPTTYECFSNGGAYFCDITLQKIESFLRAMEDDFGILPTPKWDEQQDKYLSSVNGAGGFVVAPVNTADPERTGMIMEALASADYTEITPQLYEVITKTRNVRDKESGEMVNIIIRNRVFDPFYINLMPGYSEMQTLLQKKSVDIVSAMEKKRKSAEKSMQKMIDAYTKIEE